MTVYAGDIVAKVSSLQAILSGVDDLVAAPASIRAAAVVSANALVGLIDAAILALDPQIASGGIATVASGTDPEKSITTLLALQANLNQARHLVDMRGYAGRVLINCKQAG